MKRLYLDNCCYNRPYDNQSQLLVSMETQSKLLIQALIKDGQLELATSYVLKYENENNPHKMRKETILDFMDTYGTIHVSERQRNRVLAIADGIENTGVKHTDACHVASAILSQCDYFLTTDKRLLKYSTDKIKVLSPIDFIKELGEEHVNQ